QVTVTPLTSPGSDDEDPSWSPDGLKIAFTSDRNGNPQVFTMNADGSNQTQFSQESGDAGAPSWSPDGSKIAFSTTASGNEDVGVGARGERIAVGGGWGDEDLPVWTADGSHIIFDDSSAGGLSIVGSGGAGRTPFLSDASQADVSPDGTKIVVR